MTSTAPAAVDFAIAVEAPVTDLPALAAPACPPRELVEKPLTPEGLSEMLASRQKRVGGWTPIKVAAFIEALAETSSVTAAAKYVDMSTASAYHLRSHPDAHGFREAWDRALSARFEELTDIAMERVRHGTEKVRWWKDEVVGTERVFSDRLLIHMLRRADPDRLAVTDDPAAAARAAPPPRTVLPMADDFMVAAAVDTGRLGWDPDADHDESDWPPEIREIVERRRAVAAAADAREAEELRVRRAEAAEGAARMNAKRAEEAAFAARMTALHAEDAASAADLKELSRLSNSLTCSSSRTRRRRSR
ncbi:hypothetical protein [Glacieibacterium frigidum]|uniref:Uncharacterized protein n=1 Tax=Glacieibacterium frigidum TaxID=2593303 RepID=A0A552UHB4_9SPHN|nr:hypothetical protein [Glacieibacterium frigidum]TRW17615.1 hypothetical protein FMM06_05560 [Glacieibacterium frigidum]